MDSSENQEKPLSNKFVPVEKTSKGINFFFSLIRIFIAVIILTAILFYIKVPYMYQSPGSCEDTSEFVSVQGTKKFNTHGRFYLTTVIYEHANLFFYLAGLLNPDAELVPRQKEDTFINDDTRNKYMAKQMEDSKLKAAAAAFRALGYPVRVKKGPVTVMNVAPWSKAKDMLKPGDRILKAQGKNIQNEDQLIDLIKGLPPESKIELQIKKKDGKKKEEDMVIPLTNWNGEWKIGIQIQAPIEVDRASMPHTVDIDEKNIVGSSAGLMFALEIVKQTSGIDLTGGEQIAGTGSIDEDGNLHAIEGVKFKVMAAEDAKCKYFFCPEKNYQEAKAQAKTLKVIPVKNLQEALDHLKKINPAADLTEFIEKNKGKRN